MMPSALRFFLFIIVETFNLLAVSSTVDGPAVGKPVWVLFFGVVWCECTVLVGKVR